MNVMLFGQDFTIVCSKYMVVIIVLRLQHNGPAWWEHRMMYVQVIGFEEEPTENWGYRNCLPIWEVNEIDHGIYIDQNPIARIVQGGHIFLVEFTPL